MSSGIELPENELGLTGINPEGSAAIMLDSNADGWGCMSRS